MHIPSAINSNTLKAYEPRRRINVRHDQLLESSNLEAWDQKVPKTLQELCVEAIATHWRENPILDEIVLIIDRYLLLDILETDLPLELTIPKIPDDVYWKRCYVDKWSKDLPDNVRPIEITEIFRNNDVRKLSSAFSTNGSSGTRNSARLEKFQQSRKRPNNSDHETKTWKEHYIEMFLKKHLENLRPEDYDAEKMKELADLCSPYVKVLRIEQMRCSENSPNRIPLNSVLHGFQNLIELSICFKQTYSGDTFTWNVLCTTFQDIKLLARGLETLRLQTLRIRNSDINCEKLIPILKALLRHELKVLDFSHCKIANKGTLAISKFVIEVPVKELVLANNKIGSKGIEYLSYALRQPSCTITNLDLHLNLLGDDGGNLLIASLDRSCVKSLFLSGCGFSESICLGQRLKTNNSLEYLDISNNNLGETVGQNVLNGLKFNSTIKKIDLRMCRISTETEFEIQGLVTQKRPSMIVEVHDEGYLEINNEQIIVEIETILE